MPCYTVQTCSVELNNCDLGMLQKALKVAGFTVSQNGNTLTFSKGDISGTYRGKSLDMQGAGGQEAANAIKRAYAEQVVLKKKREMESKGWTVYKEKGEYVFKKTQGIGR